MKCPACSAFVKVGESECPDCGVNLEHAKRGREKSAPEKVCRCGAVGIMSESIVGGGPWYCRQHWYEKQGFGGMEGRTGNSDCYPDKPGVRSAEWHAEMRRYLESGGKSWVYELVGGQITARRIEPLPEVL